MSTISDIVDCPQCGLPAQLDTYYIVDEEQLICDYCGYSHIRIHDKIDKSKGYGSIHKCKCNESENGSNQSVDIVRFKEPLSLLQRNQMILELQKYDINKSSLFVWNDEESKLETIVGSKPKTLDEQYIEYRNSEDYYRSCCGVQKTDKYVDFNSITNENII